MARRLIFISAVIVVSASAVFWFFRSPPLRLPFPFSQLSPTWPGEPNYWRDDLRLLGDRAAQPLLAELRRSSFRESPFLQRLRDRLPPGVARFLPDPDYALYRRRVALWALGEIGPAASNAVPDLRRIGETNSPLDQRASAIVALAKIQPHDPQSRSNLFALLSSAQQTERFHAALDFGAVPAFSPEQAQPLFRALADPDGEVRANAAFSLAQFRNWARPAVPALRALLSDSYRHVPLAAAVALVAISPEHVSETLPVVTNAVSRQADLAEALAPTYFRVAGTSAVAAAPWLESLAREAPSNFGFSRGWAALALCQVLPTPPPEAIAAVARLDPPTLPAIEVLGRLGAAASNAVPRLRTLERITVSPTARAALQKALAQITQSALADSAGRPPPEPSR